MSSAVQMLETHVADSAQPAHTSSAHNPLDGLLDTMPWLPFTLSLEVPVVRFTVGDLLRLAVGSIVETACHHTSDVPLRVNKLLIGWTEFEVIGNQLAVRITDQV